MQFGLAAALEAVYHAIGRVAAGRGQVVGDTHRHAVAAAPRQRHAHQHVVGAAFAAVHGAQRLVVRQRPVQLDIAEHVLLVEGAALEAQAQAFAHHAVRAVGADQVAAAQAAVAGIAAQRDRYAVGVLLEGGEPQPAFDVQAVHRQLVGEHALGLVFRDRDEAEGHVGGQGRYRLRHRLAVDADDLAAYRHRRVQDPPQHAHALEDLQRARLHADGFGILRCFEQRVDDAAGNAAPRQFGGRQANGACARDEDSQAFIGRLCRHEVGFDALP